MQNNKNFRRILVKLYGLLDRKQKLGFLLIIIIMMISAGLSQLTPKAIGWLTDDILTKNQVDFLTVIPFLLFILIVNVVNEVIKILRRLLVEDTATKTEKKARGIVIRSLLKASLSYFKTNMTGNIHGKLNRCLEGTIKLEKLLFMDFAPAIFNSAAAIIVIFTTLPVLLSLPMLLVIPIGTAIVLRQITTQRGIRVELLETKSAMDGTVVELLNGIEVIRITDSIDMETDRFAEKSEFLRNKEMKHHVQMAKYDIFKFINEAVFTVFMIGMSTYLATKSIITVGSVLTAYLCFTQLITPLQELHRILDELSECMVLAEEFFRMTDLPNDFSYYVENHISKENRQDSVRSADLQNSDMINIEDLGFTYDGDEDKMVLDHLNLNIHKGMFLGIAGPSGCGKSTLIKAICRLEKESYGSIEIMNRPLNTMTRKDIAGIIALVPQSPFLIAGTILENICYGLQGEIPLCEVEDAAKKAYIYDFICAQPDGFHTMISEGGSNLSGGQKQRIALARVFLRKPEILILDEATSALDNTSEKHIQIEIEKLKSENKMTVISIAHRLTTLQNCDRIIVLDKGRIVQSGKYNELIRQDGIFSDMYYGRLK